MNRRHSGWTGIVLTVLTLSALLSGVHPQALGQDPEACSGGQAWHEGRLRRYGTDVTWRGATTRVEERPVTACTPSSGNSFSAAFAMLQDNPAAPFGLIGYAQIGFFRNDAAGSCHCERYFWEYDDNGMGFTRAIWGNPMSEDTDAFRVDWQPSDNKIHLFFDANLDGNWEIPPNNGGGYEPVTPFNPGAIWSWQIPYFAEEILYQQSPYKGTSGDKTDFTVAQMRRSDSQNWINTDFIDNAGSWQNTSDLSSKGFQDTQSNTWVRFWN